MRQIDLLCLFRFRVKVIFPIAPEHIFFAHKAKQNDIINEIITHGLDIALFAPF